MTVIVRSMGIGSARVRSADLAAAAPSSAWEPHPAASTPLLTGQFAVFNQFAEINSRAEGRFMERVAPGAFKETMKRDRTRMRLLFNHGQDPTIGDKPIVGS